MSEPTAVENALGRAFESQIEKVKAHEMAVKLLVAGEFLSQEKYDQALDMATQFLPKKESTHDHP